MMAPTLFARLIIRLTVLLLLPAPLIPISIPPDRETMDYYRALILSGEMSQRALTLSAAVVELNAAHYTAWQWRRDLLVSLAAPLKGELEFVTDATRAHPKNYQVWYHRRWVVAALGAAGEELAFTAEMLAQDAKNYHAWAHRQWALKTYALWDEEAQFIDAELAKDVRNNSAWNQRRFLVAHSPPADHSPLKELSWALPLLQRAPNNESAWHYVGALEGGAVRAELEAFCRARRPQWPTCAPLVATLVDLAEERGNKGEAASLCAILRDGLDDVHQKFWAQRWAELSEK